MVNMVFMAKITRIEGMEKLEIVLYNRNIVHKFQKINNLSLNINYGNGGFVVI